MKTYTEMSRLKTFKERFDYLTLNAKVGQDTFGYNRYLNQALYHSAEWQAFRRKMIIRDEGNDLGVVNVPINGRIILHHLNPLSLYDIENKTDAVFNPDNVICVSHQTHNAIHYGTYELVDICITERSAGDTKLW